MDGRSHTVGTFPSHDKPAPGDPDDVEAIFRKDMVITALDLNTEIHY